MVNDKQRAKRARRRAVVASSLSSGVRVHGVGGDAQLDATWQGLAYLEAAGALAVVPAEAVPVRTVTRSSRWAAAATQFASADVLLVVDDPIASTSPSAEVGAPSFWQWHAHSLHKRQQRLARAPDRCWSHMAIGSVRGDDRRGGAGSIGGARPPPDHRGKAGVLGVTFSSPSTPRPLTGHEGPLR